MSLQKYLAVFFTANDRFPSRRDLLQAFLVSAFPVAIWSWVIFFYDLPSFLLSLRIGQIINVFFYIQAIVLIESALLFILVTLLAVLLPRVLFRKHYLAQTSLLILALTAWAVGVHLNGEQVALGNLSGDAARQYIWTAVWVVVFLALSILVRFWPRFNALIQTFIERLSFVSGIYLFFPVVSLPYLVIRYIVLLIL